MQQYDVTTTTRIDGGALAAIIGVGLLLTLVTIVAGWRIYRKAGQPGWAILVPFYNIYVLLKIVGRPGWWLILFLIPLVNIVVSIIVAIDLAKSFGKGGAFGFFALWLFSIIGYCILGFGNARYVGPAAAGPGQQPGQQYPGQQYPGQQQHSGPQPGQQY